MLTVSMLTMRNLVQPRVKCVTDGSHGSLDPPTITSVDNVDMEVDNLTCNPYLTVQPLSDL